AARMGGGRFWSRGGPEAGLLTVFGGPAAPPIPATPATAAPVPVSPAPAITPPPNRNTPAATPPAAAPTSVLWTRSWCHSWPVRTLWVMVPAAAPAAPAAMPAAMTTNGVAVPAGAVVNAPAGRAARRPAPDARAAN